MVDLQEVEGRKVSVLQRLLGLFRPAPALAPAAVPVPAPVEVPPIRMAPAVPRAAEFIAQFEGFEAKPYRCPAGVWTRYPDGRAVTGKDEPCTRAQALAWLEHDIAGAEAALKALVKVPLTAGQRVALTSFVYNVGVGAFTSSTLLQRLNRQKYADAGRELDRWTRGGGKVLPGLVKRRAAEQALFEG
jgi:lysozyme